VEEAQRVYELPKRKYEIGREKEAAQAGNERRRTRNMLRKKEVGGFRHRESMYEALPGVGTSWFNGLFRS